MPGWVKTDQQGNKLWDKTYGGFSNDYLNNIIPLADGGFLLGVRSFSGISEIKLLLLRVAKITGLFVLIAEGNKLWDNSFGGRGNDILARTAMVALPDGGFLLGGWSNSGVSGDRTATSRGGDDYWVVKVDANGQKQWDRAFGGSGRDVMFSCLSLGDGSALLSGASSSFTSGDKSEASRGGYDYWILNIDANGNKVWDKTFGGDRDDLSRNRILALPDGDFMIGGYSLSGILAKNHKPAREKMIFG